MWHSAVSGQETFEAVAPHMTDILHGVESQPTAPQAARMARLRSRCASKHEIILCQRHRTVQMYAQIGPAIAIDIGKDIRAGRRFRVAKFAGRV